MIISTDIKFESIQSRIKFFNDLANNNNTKTDNQKNTKKRNEMTDHALLTGMTVLDKKIVKHSEKDSEKDSEKGVKHSEKGVKHSEKNVTNYDNSEKNNDNSIQNYDNYEKDVKNHENINSCENNNSCEKISEQQPTEQNIIEQKIIEQKIIEQKISEQNTTAKTEPPILMPSSNRFKSILNKFENMIQQLKDEENKDVERITRRKEKKHSGISVTFFTDCNKMDNSLSNKLNTTEDTVEEKTVVDKTLVDKTVEEKAVVDKTVVDKTVDDKIVVDKTLDDKTVVDKTVVDKTLVDTAEDKTVEHKTVEHKIVEEKPVEQATVEQVIEHKTVHTEDVPKKIEQQSDNIDNHKNDNNENENSHIHNNENVHNNHIHNNENVHNDDNENIHNDDNDDSSSCVGTSNPDGFYDSDTMFQKWEDVQSEPMTAIKSLDDSDEISSIGSLSENENRHTNGRLINNRFTISDDENRNADLINSFIQYPIPDKDRQFLLEKLNKIDERVIDTHLPNHTFHTVNFIHTDPFKENLKPSYIRSKTPSESTEPYMSLDSDKTRPEPRYGFRKQSKRPNELGKRAPSGSFSQKVRTILFEHKVIAEYKQDQLLHYNKIKDEQVNEKIKIIKEYVEKTYGLMEESLILDEHLSEQGDRKKEALNGGCHSINSDDKSFDNKSFDNMSFDNMSDNMSFDGLVLNNISRCVILGNERYESNELSLIGLFETFLRHNMKNINSNITNSKNTINNTITNSKNTINSTITNSNITNNTSNITSNITNKKTTKSKTSNVMIKLDTLPDGQLLRFSTIAKDVIDRLSISKKTKLFNYNQKRLTIDDQFIVPDGVYRLIEYLTDNPGEKGLLRTCGNSKQIKEITEKIINGYHFVSGCSSDHFVSGCLNDPFVSDCSTEHHKCTDKKCKNYYTQNCCSKYNIRDIAGALKQWLSTVDLFSVQGINLLFLNKKDQRQLLSLAYIGERKKLILALVKMIQAIHRVQVNDFESNCENNCESNSENNSECSENNSENNSENSTDESKLLHSLCICIAPCLFTSEVVSFHLITKQVKFLQMICQDERVLTHANREVLRGLALLE